MDKSYRQLTREEKRRQRRASAKYRLAHATRERMRVEVRGEREEFNSHKWSKK